jgi:uncharacterized membrane protein YraQ (UPF0718 family)
MNPRFKESGRKTFNSFKATIPILIGVLLLISLFITAVPGEVFAGLFTGNVVTDSLVGAIFGSIMAGNPINSYIIGGELLKQGISLFAIIAFILAWVTVGIVQFPAESLMLGKRFATVRNLVSFCLCIVIALLTVLTLGLV